MITNKAYQKVLDLKKQHREMIAKAEDAIDYDKLSLRKAKVAYAENQNDDDIVEYIEMVEDSIKHLEEKRDKAFTEMDRLVAVDTCVRFAALIRELMRTNEDFRIFFSQEKIRRHLSKDMGEMLYEKN